MLYYRMLFVFMFRGRLRLLMLDWKPLHPGRNSNGLYNTMWLAKVVMLIEAYSLKNLQDFRSLARSLDGLGVSPDSWLEEIEKEIKARLEIRGILDERMIPASDFMRQFSEKTKTCPVCGNKLSLTSVNTQPGNQVGEGYKSLWFCGKCLEHEEYSKQSMTKILNDLGFKRRKGPQKQKVKTGYAVKRYHQKRRR